MKKLDCIEMKYEGRIATNNLVFDKTEKPIAIIVGARYVIKGLDDSLLEHNIGDKYTIKIKPEDAFGMRHGDFMKLIPLSTFREHNINPYIGQTVNVDNKIGIVRSVSGGRSIVDFNHPLAGKEVEYSVEIVKEVTDSKEKIEAMILFRTGLTNSMYKIDLTKEKCVIEYKDKEKVFKVLGPILENDIKSYAGIKNVEIKKYDETARKNN